MENNAIQKSEIKKNWKIKYAVVLVMVFEAL